MAADRHRAGRRRWWAATGLALASVATVAMLLSVRQTSHPVPATDAGNGHATVEADVKAAARATDPAPAQEPVPLRVRAARSQIGVTRFYDPAYVTLPYPGGDVPVERGVCTDVVIRALRHEGLDLQQAVHEDMRAHFNAYPALWGLRGPDRNIDHRRVPNLRRWFERQGWALAAGDVAGGDVPGNNVFGNFRPGDLVTWTLPGGLPHIGIVSERRNRDGVPLIIHNIGSGTREEDMLFTHAMTGHYRPPLD